MEPMGNWNQLCAPLILGVKLVSGEIAKMSNNKIPNPYKNQESFLSWSLSKYMTTAIIMAPTTYQKICCSKKLVSSY